MKIQNAKPGLRADVGAKGVAACCAMLLTLALASPARSEMMIPRDSSNAYQLNPHAKVRHVLLQEGDGNQARAAMRLSLERLALRYGFRLDTNSGAGTLTSALLEGVDVVVFVSGFDGRGDPLVGPESPTPSDSATTTMERFIYERGGAMLAVHGAAQFITCPGTGTGGGGNDIDHPDCRFLARAVARQYHAATASQGNSLTLYVDSVRAGEVPPHPSQPPHASDSLRIPPPATHSHGVSNPETRAVFTGLPRVWPDLGDRWYRFTSSARLVDSVIIRSVPNLDSMEYAEGPVNVLVSLDEGSENIGTLRRMGDHPLSWTRKMGNGLSAYNNAGSYDLYTRSDSIIEKFNWRLIRYLARDFVGCTEPGYAEYNPEATVTVLSPGFDDPEPCKTPVSLRSGVKGITADFWAGSRDGKILLQLYGTGVARIRVTDVTGRQVHVREASTGARSLEIAGLRPGIYFVRVTMPGRSARTARVNLL